jgi:hypothetical protein
MGVRPDLTLPQRGPVLVRQPRDVALLQRFRDRDSGLRRRSDDGAAPPISDR